MQTRDIGETLKSFWVMNVSPSWRKKIANMVFLWKFQGWWGGGGGGERCAAARLDSSLCQGYKQAVIRPPNRIILPVSAPKHMGPHKAAAAPDRHPLLITQRRGAGPFSPCAFPFSASVCLCLAVCRGNTFDFRGGSSHVVSIKGSSWNAATLYHGNISDIVD